jgi:hypothetical protein
VLSWAQIDPRLALSELGSSSPQAVFWTALDDGNVETAYASLVYAINVKPEERCGLLLALARSEVTQDRPSYRAACYDAAASVATVAVDMSDLSRATTLLEAGRGMAELGADAKALFYLDQAYATARYSDQMGAVHRRSVLDELIPLYRQMGRRPESWQALLEQVQSPASASGEQRFGPVQVERPELLYSSVPLLEAAAARQRMVAKVLQTAEQGTGTIEQVQRDDLAAALRHEDQIRQGAQTARQDQELSQQELVSLARDDVAWKWLQSRVAHRGYGVSIVPEWEERVSEIDAELGAACDAFYERLVAILQDQYETAEDPTVQRAVLLLQLEHGLLGFYPDWPRREWAAHLEHLEPKPALRVVSRTEDKDVRFFLTGGPVPDEGGLQ